MIDATTAIARARAVLAAEAAAVNRARLALGQEFLDALSLLYHSKGKVVVSGMGKVGHVGRRFAATLCSTGQPAVFLHPGEAAHGDLGVVAQHDILIVLSNSGKTREALELMDRAAHLWHVPVLVVTGNRESLLAQRAPLLLCYGLVMEPCHVGLTPSASLAAMSALLDALALALSEQRGFTREDFHARHHAGYLGQKARGEV